MVSGLLISCVGYAVAHAMSSGRGRGPGRGGGRGINGSHYMHGAGVGGRGGRDVERGGGGLATILPFQRHSPKYGSVEVQRMDLGGGHVHTRYQVPLFGSPQK